MKNKDKGRKKRKRKLLDHFIREWRHHVAETLRKKRGGK